jgi:hypothetical protein
MVSQTRRLKARWRQRVTVLRRLNWAFCTSASLVAAAPTIAFPLAGAATVAEVAARPRVAVVSIAIMIARICVLPFVSKLSGVTRIVHVMRREPSVICGNFAVLTTREALAAPRYDTQGLANRIFLHSPRYPIRRCLNKWPCSRSSLVHCRVARYP